jgi:hypothetical protein
MCARGLAGAWLAIVAGASLASAQEKLLPIQLGAVRFYPSVILATAWEDNVERVNEDDPLLEPVPSLIRGVRPILRFELPILEKNLVSAAYRGDYRSYSAEELKDAGGASHFVDFTAHFEAPTRFRLDAEQHFVDGISELLSTSPGGEFRYTTQPLKARESKLGFALDIGPIQSIELGGSHNVTEFQQSATSSFFSDFRMQNYFLRYVFSEGVQTKIYFSADVQQVEQTRTDLVLQPDDYRTRSVGAGFRRANRELSSDFRMAYSATDFQDQIGTPFRGVTLEADLNFQLSITGQMQVKLRRAPLLSFFNVSAYYINEAAALNYRYALGRSVGLQLFLGYQRNTFSEPVRVHVESPDEAVLDQQPVDGIIDAYAYLLPSDGETRRDHLYAAGLTVIWHMTRGIDFSAGYLTQRSESNIQGLNPVSGDSYIIYQYNSEGITVAAILGWQ